MANTYRGDSSDGKSLFITIGDVGVSGEIVATVPLSSGFYAVVKLLDPLDGKKAGEMMVFEFDGDIGDMSGNYTTVSSKIEQAVLNEANVGGGNQPDPKPEPEHEPEPEYEPEEEEEQEQTHNDTYEEEVELPFYQDYQTAASPDTFHSGGSGWLVTRNVFYILGIITGFAIFVGAPMALGIFLSIQGNNLMASGGFMGVIMVGVVMVFFVLGSIGSILAMKNRHDLYHKSHNAAIVLGLVTLNIPAMIGGWCNYHYRLFKYKARKNK